MWFSLFSRGDFGLIVVCVTIKLGLGLFVVAYVGLFVLGFGFVWYLGVLDLGFVDCLLVECWFWFCYLLCLG